MHREWPFRVQRQFKTLRRERKDRHTCLEYLFRYMLARQEWVEDPTRKEVHGVPCAAHRRLGLVVQVMGGKKVLAIVRQRQPFPMLILSHGDLTRRMGTSMCLWMLIARPKMMTMLARRGAEYGLYVG